MAKLEPQEREALLRPLPMITKEPRPRRLSPAGYAAFATQMSRFFKPRKFRPIQGGEHWKL